MLRAPAVALALCAIPLVAGAVRADDGCLVGPERIDKGLQRYYVNNACGVPVQVRYRVREGDARREAIWVIPACLPVKQGIAFPVSAEVEFLPPEVPETAPQECYFASQHPRGDVDVEGAMALLKEAVHCALPEERNESEGMVTLQVNRLVREQDYLVLIERRSVAVTNDFEISRAMFDAAMFIAYSRLASALPSGRSVVLGCTGGETCIKRYTQTAGDCGDDAKCEAYADVPNWNIETCDAVTAGNAALAIEELMRANRPPEAAATP